MTYSKIATPAVVVGLVLLLELSCRLGWIAPTVLVPPSVALVSLIEILVSGQFNSAIAVTVSNVVVATVLAVIGGFLLGVVIHANDFLRRGVEPFLASYYAVPTFIFYPVFIVLLGVGNASIIAIAVLLSIVAMITATLNGLDRVPAVLGKTSRVLKLSPIQAAFLVKLPAAAPYLFTGARLSVAYAFIGVIASEFLLSGNGLGYAIAYAYNMFENRTMYGLMLLIILLVTVTNMALSAVDRRLQARIRR
ncbi:ABC transporter permease [Xanthobacter agilis]|jgi:NitT/TauT family transport system permease protein|uniref:NitT/TauT family transport system permease protein n=1 Tax=Xanthobacter agilis TaxID=47492 RepID=A0ABU0LH21_XANAG|nr:ABC transporter permease subunit [Xanthobacter agilis]MDQ0506436.1 NitT/TauT family transport system permease protein [Xanthobacter agilis]